ncbi:hypothetical protein [Lactobacillus intestinalis]|nr:hypothetical protein [Lactobacillus intestinalis]
MAQQMLNEKGVLPKDFYSNSLSDFAQVQAAQSREDREIDPFELIKNTQ